MGVKIFSWRLNGRLAIRIKFNHIPVNQPFNQGIFKTSAMIETSWLGCRSPSAARSTLSIDKRMNGRMKALFLKTGWRIRLECTSSRVGGDALLYFLDFHFFDMAIIRLGDANDDVAYVKFLSRFRYLPHFT